MEDLIGVSKIKNEVAKCGVDVDEDGVRVLYENRYRSP